MILLLLVLIALVILTGAILHKKQDNFTLAREESDNPIDFSNKTWQELEQAYHQMIQEGFYGQLQFIELARANILFKEKKYHDSVIHYLERAYLAIQGSGFSKDHTFDGLPRRICFTQKEWKELCETEFFMIGDFGRAISWAKMTEKDVTTLFINSRYRGLPYNVDRQECVPFIKSAYKKYKAQTNYDRTSKK